MYIPPRFSAQDHCQYAGKLDPQTKALSKKCNCDPGINNSVKNTIAINSQELEVYPKMLFIAFPVKY
jgi:hypothetical protein